MSETTIPRAAAPSTGAWASTPAIRAAMLLLLLLLLQLPLLAVSGLIDERQSRRDEVQSEFRRLWGPGQTVLGPVLAIPYSRVFPPAKRDAEPQTETGWLEIPAAQLNITAKLDPETRHRGLFPATVYTAMLAFDGTIDIPALTRFPGPAPELAWADAVLVTAASDLRAQAADTMAEIAGRPVRQSIQATRGGCGGTLFAPLPIAAAPAPGTTIAFRTALTLHGTQSIGILPRARQLAVHMTAPWRSPGFTGTTLPLAYEIDGQGFRADWQASGDAASAGPRLAPGASPSCLQGSEADYSLFGVDLLEAVPTYLMVNRAAKYGTLFIALAFLVYFLFETVGGARIHLAQYALLGLSVSLFALILVALAEPLGFTAGYALGTLAVMAQASLYTFSVVGSARRAATFAAVLGLLFAFLYVVLRLESFALLAGTAALFAGLSAIMVVTRRLDWSGRALAAAP